MSQPQILSDYDFGEDFEMVVLATLIRSPRFYQKYQSIVDPEAFTDMNAKFVVTTLQDFWKKYKKSPERSVLDDMIRKSHHRSPLEVIRMLDGLPKPANQGYVADRMLLWSRWRSIDLVLSTDEYRADPDELARQILKASRVGADLSENHTKLDDPDDDDITQMPVIPTPWPTANEKIHGGPQMGDFAYLITVINGGKTTGLVNIARHAVECGKFVVYGTFEDGEKKIKRRMMQSLCNMTMDELANNRKEARERVNQILNKSKGKFEVKKLTTRRTTVYDMIGWVKSVEDSAGRKVDMVISDYSDRYRPPNTRYNEPRHALREISEDCKHLAMDLQVVHWTASQSNKGQTGKDTLGIEHGSEGYGKFESCDFAFGLGQTMEDQRTGRISLTASKVRDAEKGWMLSLVADFAKQRIFEADAGAHRRKVGQ